MMSVVSVAQGELVKLSNKALLSLVSWNFCMCIYVFFLFNKTLYLLLYYDWNIFFENQVTFFYINKISSNCKK